MGLYYGAGSYGVNIFDNMYKLYLKSGAAGSKPIICTTVPEMELNFINALITENNAFSSTILGIPFSNERYLKGSLFPNSSEVVRGDIPDPALYAAKVLTNNLENIGIHINGRPTCNRLLNQSCNSLLQERQGIIKTYSPSLSEIIKVTNYFSCNLYADSLLKTIGALYLKEDKSMTFFDKSIKVLKNFWEERGINCNMILYDGSGLASTNRVTSEFVSEILEYMATKSICSEKFMNSLPAAGVNGNVKDFLHDTYLQNKAKLKSGSISKVQCYAGYMQKGEKSYIEGILVNLFS